MVAQDQLAFGDLENLERYVGTTFSQFGDSYNTSRKEPDMCVRPVRMALPTIVLESGWSESRPQFYKDRDLWLKRGPGAVQLAMVIKWTKNAAKRVKGNIEVFDVDGAGNASPITNEVVFPTPSPPPSCRCASPNHHHQQRPFLGSAGCQCGHCSSASDHYG